MGRFGGQHVPKRRKLKAPKLSPRQRGAAGVFAEAEALGYRSAFPDPAEARAFIAAQAGRVTVNAHVRKGRAVRGYVRQRGR